jgi:CheY-like chemotaxis protein
MIRILAIEDAPVEAELLRTMLGIPGIEVTFDDGSNAWNIITSIPPVDVVVLDLILHGITGWRIIGQIRTRRDWARVPIIVVSGARDTVRVKRAINLGANTFSLKPYDVRKLKKTLERFIGPLEAADSAAAEQGSS